MLKFKLVVLALGIGIASFAQTTEMTVSSSYGKMPEQPSGEIHPRVAESGGVTESLTTVAPREVINRSSVRRKAEGTEDLTPKYMIANVISMTPTTKNGIYKFQFNGEDHTGTALKTQNMGTFGAVHGDGKYLSIHGIALGSSLNNKYDYVFSDKDWSLIASRTKPNLIKMVCGSYDDTTGKIWAYYYDYGTGYYYFGSYDMETSEARPLMAMTAAIASAEWAGLAADEDGSVYVLKLNGDLVKINTLNGAETQIGATGIKPTYNKCSFAAIDPQDGKLYAGVYKAKSTTAFYEIDKATGKGTYLYDIPNEVVGLYFPEEDPNVLSPGAPLELKAEFADGSLSGNITFIAPTVRSNGSEGAGPIDWTIMANGKQIANGKTVYGEKVVAPVTLPSAGNYGISVYLSNAAGNGSKAKIHDWFGPNFPAPIKSVFVEYKNDHFEITWAKPQSANGGELDYSKITYDIVRNPGDVSVAKGISETTFSDPYPMPSKLTTFSFTVSMYYNGELVSSTTSQDFPLGHIVPPYNADFSTPGQLDDFTIIDANGDKITWEYNSTYKNVRISPSKENMDDWLLLPPARMTKGKVYRIAFRAAKAVADHAEKICAYIGTSPNIQTLLTPIIPVTEINIPRGDGGQVLEAYFTAPADGDYTVGIYGCSPADQWYLYVDDVEIDAPMDAMSPNCVTELNASSPEDGSLKATISFVAPTKTLSGADLPAITKIEIYKDSVVCATLNAKPGEQVSWTDEKASNGINSYKIVPYSAEGNGKRAEIDVFVGFDMPENVLAVKNYIGDNEGQAVITWSPVTKDVRGRTLKAEDVTYTVERMHRNPDVPEVIATGLKETTLKDQIAQADAEQYWMQYRVTAETASGKSIATPATTMVPIGKPYALPFAESFSNVGLSYLWEVRTVQGQWYWQISSDTALQNVKSQDGDNGFLVYVGKAKDEESIITSGKIAIPENTQNPTLVFYYYVSASECSNLLKVWINGGDGERVLASEIVCGGATGWQKASIPMTAWIGKNVQLSFDAILKNYDSVLVDNIRIESFPDYDLALTGVNVPMSVMAGQTLEGSVDIINKGTRPVDKFTVEISRDYKVVATLTNNATLAPEKSVTLPFADVTDVLLNGSVAYKASVVFESDERADNNTAISADVLVLESSYPAPLNVSAEQSGEYALVKWESPDLSASPYLATTETFEKMLNLSTDLGEWKTVDADGLPCGGLQGLPLDGVNGVARGFFPLITADEALSKVGFTSHSGAKVMVSMYGYDDNNKRILADDWLISPELAGDAQTVSLYARSYHPSYLETIEILYSSTTQDVSAFTRVARYENVPTVWTKYEAQIPAGAKYFAIRNVSDDKYILMVDDVTFVPTGSERQKLELKGYNVYRNGVRVNRELLSSVSIEDREVNADSSYTYFVTAVYDLGEGTKSREVEITIKKSGVGEMDNVSVGVSTAPGVILVSGAEGKIVAVYTADGKMQYRDKSDSQLFSITVEPGIYVVVADDKSVKTIVK